MFTAAPVQQKETAGSRGRTEGPQKQAQERPDTILTLWMHRDRQNQDVVEMRTAARLGRGAQKGFRGPFWNGGNILPLAWMMDVFRQCCFSYFWCEGAHVRVQVSLPKCVCGGQRSTFSFTIAQLPVGASLHPHTPLLHRCWGLNRGPHASTANTTH